MSLYQLLDDSSLLDEPRDTCAICLTQRDSHGCCECDPPAVVCMYCETLVTHGRGLDQWEAGEDDPPTISHGCCDACFQIQMEKIR